MIKVDAYKCDFCDKVMLSLKKMAKHELTCVNRTTDLPCDSCPPLDKMDCATTGVKKCKSK
jgi:hypothetical protein